MLSERSRTTIPVERVGSTLCTRTSPLRAEAAAAATHAIAAIASTARTRRVAREFRRNAAASYVSTAGRLRIDGLRLGLEIGHAVREEHRPCLRREPARRLDQRRPLGPREPPRGAGELRVLPLERVGDELERAPPVGGAVLGRRLLEEGERLNERRQRRLGRELHDRLGRLLPLRP